MTFPDMPAEAGEGGRLWRSSLAQMIGSGPDAALDALTRALARQLDCPMALVCLRGEAGPCIRSCHGFAQVDTPRDDTLWAHAFVPGAVLEVPDLARDPRFQHSPLVAGTPGMRFHAGVCLAFEGQAIGMLCVFDTRPRSLTLTERDCLLDMALAVQACIAREVDLLRAKAGEQRQRDLLSAATDFVWEVDAQWRFTWVSHGAEALLGVPARALIGQSLCQPALLDACGEPVAGEADLRSRLPEGEQPATLLVELPVPDADRAGRPGLPVLLSAFALRDAHGRLVGWRGTAKDMRGLLEGASRSRELQTRLSNIASQLPGVIFMIERLHDGHLRLPYASEGLQRVFGCSPESVADDAAGLLAAVDTAQRKRLLADLQQSARSGEAWTFECCLQAPSGAQRWVGGRAMPRQEPDGRTVWYGYAADFTERRTARQAVAEVTRNLQQALDIGGLGVVSLERAQGEVRLDANALTLHGLAGGEHGTAVAMPVAQWLDAVDADDRPALEQALATAAGSPLPQRLSYRLAAAGPARRIALQIDHAPTSQRLVGLCRDVSDHEHAERAREATLMLHSAREQQTEFLSRVSHELRTPMNAILGFVELMRSDRVDPLAPRHQAWSQQVMDAGKHLMTLINDLLDLTRIDSGHQALAPEPVPVQRLVGSCQALLDPLALQRQVVLAAPAGDAALRVWADRRALGQVLLNIVGNAIKFNRPGGTVHCEFRAEPGRGVITVLDEGPGVAPDRRDKLFQPFERLGRTHDSEGSGLGLAISRRLVEAMAGRLAAEFPEQGGTRMRIELPLAPTDAACDADGADAGAAAAAGRAQPAAGAAPRRAIYAGASAADARLLQSSFELRSDWVVEVAPCATTLRAALAASNFELVILDLDGRDLAGLEVARELAAQPRLAAAFFVALSAQGFPAQIDEAMRAGFDDYWIKPLDAFKLHDRLDTLPRRAAPAN